MRFLILIMVVAISGCVSTSETQLAQGVWQINAEARTRSARGGIGQTVTKKAAELTLANGYTHFVLTSGRRDERSNLVYTGYAGGYSPLFMNQEITNQSYIIQMFHAGDPNASKALDARQVLAQ